MLLAVVKPYVSIHLHLLETAKLLLFRTKMKILTE